MAAKEVIARTGADPNFVYDQAKRHPEKASVFEMGFRPQDPGPMRYTCRVEDCCAVGGIRLAFSTEEELVAQWNTFHVAVAPQFTCQVSGCKAMFAADPGALDCYLHQVGQKMAEEERNPRFRGERHTLKAVPEALSVRPNPFFKPPGSTFGVPRRTARVVAPPKCHPHADTGLSILNIRWAFRKLFEKKVCADLAQHGTEREKKRARRDSLSDRPSKRAKLDLEHRRRSNPSEDGRTSTSSKSSKRSGPNKTKKILKVKLGKQCQTLVSPKASSLRKAGRHRRSSTSSSAPSDRSGRRANLASQGEVRVTVPNEQDPMRAGPTEQ